METAKGTHRIAGIEPAHSPLGRIMITQRASHVVTDEDIRAALERHLETHREKFPANGLPSEGVQLLSSHRTTTGEKFWILTDCGHHATTLLLPSEY
jgi:hypothetical protein